MKLQSRLPQIATELGPAARQAARAGARIVEDAAKARVPIHTGRLRAAIHTEDQPEGVAVIAGDRRAWYGHIVEHGGRYTPAQPFLVPAFEENRDLIITEVTQTIRHIIG